MLISIKTMEIFNISRCADISDAMDSMGLQELYNMEPIMRPLIPQTRFCGVARTMEFNRTDERMPYMSYEDFEKLQYAKKKDGGFSFMDNLSKPDSFFENAIKNMAECGEGDVIVCSCHGLQGGIFGSDNSMDFAQKGFEGIIIDGYMRDTDECIKEKINVFSKGISYVHPQGRLQLESVNEPIVCAGVRVCPGDVICADNDGIIAVPQKYADETAYRAYKIQKADRISRRKNYEKIGIPFDETVELLPEINRWF